VAAHAATAPAGGLTLRGYPVLLPKLSDPRLHLAAVITSLQILGQAAFDFRVSIAQILISLGTCAVLEVGITFAQKRVLMWPASALLTGNGVAFILRVPGTRHGDWWSTRGWWIFAGTAAVSLLSKYVIQWRGSHPFNPSNIGLVICFLALGRTRAEPLDFWWGPMSWWLALALAIILVGGFAILSRLKLLVVAVSFWLAFATGIGILAATNHAMTARWHLGPVHGAYFWWVLLTSPEVLVFLFFMITDPRTAPKGRGPRAAYAISVGLLAAALIAPLETEYATKVALLGALAIVCAVQPFVRRVRVPRPALALALVAYVGVLVAAGIPARLSTSAAAPLPPGALPAIDVLPSRGVQGKLELPAAQRIAHALVARVPAKEDDHVRIWLVRGVGQEPPRAKAQLAGRTYTLAQQDGVWALATAPPLRMHLPRVPALPGYSLARVPIDFRQGAFRYGVVNDPPAMMGGGLCWLDYDNDGWLDLFVVNGYADGDIGGYSAHGGLPRTALFHNVHGRFVNATRSSHAGRAVRGEGCVAGDLNGDGYTDLFVTTAQSDELLWNNGDGTFTEGARSHGIVSYGWHSGAAIADVNGDGRMDLFVAGYAEMNGVIAGSSAGFPTNHLGVRDELFLNEGDGRFREVGTRVGIDPKPYDHSLGALFTDVNGDGRLDLFVANDEDPNRLYLNEPGGALGFHFVESAKRAGVADPNAGMGIAASPPLLFVSNSRGQTHAFYRVAGHGRFDPVDAATWKSVTAGWGASWVDLKNTGSPDLVLANGAIPITDLKKDAERLQVFRTISGGYVDTGALQHVRVNGRGVAAADFDNDGRVDIAVNTIGGPLLLLRNTSPARHWLEVDVKPFSPGAVVRVDDRPQVVLAGSSYLSSEDPRVHFGVLSARYVDVTVRFPDGTTRHLRDVPVDRVLTVRR
jgi:FG-GAP-like repeat/ASPIC and UnbV